MRIISLGVLLTPGLFFACAMGFKARTEGSYLVFDHQAQLHQSKKPSGPDVARIGIFYKKDPPKKFIEVGLVEAVSRGHKVEIADLMEGLKYQAAIVGADAIYKIEVNRYDHGVQAMHATGVAIRFEK